MDAQVKQLRSAGAEKVFRRTASGARTDRAGGRNSPRTRSARRSSGATKAKRCGISLGPGPGDLQCNGQRRCADADPSLNIDGSHPIDWPQLSAAIRLVAQRADASIAFAHTAAWSFTSKRMVALVGRASGHMAKR